MGGSSTSKTNSDTNSTSHLVQTPTNPDWVTNSTQALQDRINGLLSTDPQSLVAGPSALQSQAYANAGSLLGGASPIGTASGYAPTNVPTPTAAPSLLTTPTSAATPTPTASPSPGTATPSVTGIPSIPTAASGQLTPAQIQQIIADRPDVLAAAQANPAGGDVNANINNWYASGKQAAGDPYQLPTTQTAPAPVAPTAPVPLPQTPAATPGTSPLAGANATAQARATSLLGAATTPSQAGAGSLLDTNLDKYANPELNSVVHSTLADFDANAGQTRAQQALALARNQKFGGSGSAITQALTEGELARGRASAEAGLRSGAYDTAANLAEQDLGRQATTSMFNAGQANNLATSDRAQQLQATGLLGDLGNASEANNRADIGLLSDLGDKQQQTQNGQLGANINVLKTVDGLNAAQPYNLYHGATADGTGTSSTNSTTNTSSSDPLGALGKALQVASLFTPFAPVGAASMAGDAGMMLSDKRLKTDIKKLGSSRQGIPVVSYRYKGEPKGTERIGHLAQDVEKKRPDAVKTLPSGMKAVNYGLLSQGAV